MGVSSRAAPSVASYFGWETQVTPLIVFVLALLLLGALLPLLNLIRKR
jgi:uncharacterized integral membrane protein